MSTEADEFETLREGLTRLAERPGPPSSIDVEAARLSGQHTVRFRQGTWAGVGVAIVTAGALCAVLLPSASHGSATAPGTPTASLPEIAVTPVPMDIHGDPVSMHVVLGDVPSGYHLWQTTESNDIMMLEYQGHLSAGSAGVDMISLTVAGHGDLPPVIGGGVTGDSTSVQVNGQSGQLVVYGPGPGQTGVTGARLTWQDLAGRKYALTDAFNAGTDVRAQMLALADSATVGLQAVPQPFYFSHLPAGLGYVSAEAMDVGMNQVQSSNYSIELGEGSSTEVTFGLYYGISVDGSLTPGAPETSSPSNGQLPPDESSSEPVVASPVPTDDNSGLCENLADGWQLCVELTGPMPTDIAAQGGLTGLLGDVTALDANRPQSFTTFVIR